MQHNYRSFPQQPPQRSPHAANAARRGIGPMGATTHAPGPMTPAAVPAPVTVAMPAHDRLKFSSRKPTDTNLPDGLDALTIGDGVQRYAQLKEVERRLDSTITRKRLDIQDFVNRNVKRSRTLRIWIGNTVENQAWQADSLDVDTFDFNTHLEPVYRVKVEARLLDEDEAFESDFSDDEASPHTPPESARPRFSHFIKALSADFERNRGKNSPDRPIEWQKSNTTAPAAEFDQLEFKRAGDENMNITINLFRDETPERFLLRPALAEILDTDVATRAEALMGVWDYIKVMGLQDDDEKRSFECDNRLKALLQRDKGYIPYLAESINQHLAPMPPVKLPYTIRVDKAFHESPQATIYDVQVQMDDPLKTAFAAYLANPTYVQNLREIALLHDHLALLVQRIYNSKAKYGFLEALSQDPTQFIMRWLSSQKRDLEVISGVATRGGQDASGDDWRKGGQDSIWTSNSVRESVNLMVSQRTKV
ncbi:unnamed protein product [Blumeria hordei]|uniref:DM2 domain-containing protein n=1 Tax=Blumeria hordei TaxID=2867405 RepID=A0A383V430_BLUHO|nr:unnamed protein product [Blumeria hordei]